MVSEACRRRAGGGGLLRVGASRRWRWAMKMWRPVMRVLPAPLLALGAGAPPALAQPGFGGSGLTITALSPDTTTPYSGTQDSIYLQLSGNAPSGGTVVTTTSSNQSVMPVPSSITVPAGSSVGQVDFTA